MPQLTQPTPVPAKAAARWAAWWLERLRQGSVLVLRRLGARAYLGLAWVLSMLLLVDMGQVGLLVSADTRLFDTLVAHRIHLAAPDPELVIVDIDEASLASMANEYGRWPWPNVVLGELVQHIEAQGPRALVFDILFSDADVHRPASDAVFNAVVAASRTTFFPMLRLAPHNDALSRIPASALPGAWPLHAQADPTRTVAMVLPKVPAALDQGRLGTHQLTPDKDGVVRRYPAWVEVGDWGIPSLPQRVNATLQGRGVAQREVLLNWRGKPFAYPYVSFETVYRQMRGEAGVQPNVDFHNKIVLIGSTAPSLFDVKGTPMARIHPGVEVLATAIDNFRHGDYLHELPAWVVRLVALGLIWVMAWALYKQVRIEVFDTLFGVTHGLLVGGAFLLLNVSNWYVDTSVPLSLGVLFFTLCRLYHRVSHRLLATGEVRALGPKGECLLALLAVRLDGMQNAERRALKGLLDRLVADSPLQAGRTSRLVEDPGFVQSVLADVMLVHWLCPDLQAPWQQDAQRIQAALQTHFSAQVQTGRLGFVLTARTLNWQTSQGWNGLALMLILDALRQLGLQAAQVGTISPEACTPSHAPSTMPDAVHTQTLSPVSAPEALR